MAVGEPATYARAFFRLDYPAGWRVRENALLGMTEFHVSAADPNAYEPGIALITIPETGMDLDPLLRTGLFLITRDLDNPSIDRLAAQPLGALTWHRLLVRGYAPPLSARPSRVPIVKQVALSRPGPGVLVLALHGPADEIAPLEPAFETLLRSVRLVP